MVNSLNKLIQFIETSDFQGYDPYDILNARFNFKSFGKWGPAVAIQFHKRNPFNIRPLLGIRKGYNPKGMGLFLKAYSLLFQKTGQRPVFPAPTSRFYRLSAIFGKEPG